jgi:hypothetical protein
LPPAFFGSIALAFYVVFYNQKRLDQSGLNPLSALFCGEYAPVA